MDDDVNPLLEVAGIPLVPCAAPGCDEPEHAGLAAGLCRTHVGLDRTQA